MNKIAFFDTKPYDRKSFDFINESFNFDIHYFEPRLDNVTVDLAAGFEVVCAFVNDTLDEDVLQKLYDNGTRLLAMRCAGYNNVDVRQLPEGLKVVRVPAYSPYAVAEHTVALIMTLNRKTHKAYSRTRDGNFSLNGLLGLDMHGKTAGVIGAGKIGKCLINILLGFGMKVLVYDPFPDDEFAKEKGITYVKLDQIYAESNVICLNCPLTAETEYMINKGSIARMQDKVMLINTGRGRLIDTIALIDGLKSGKVGSAGLDVYEEEGGYFFEDHSINMIQDDNLARLMTFPNVLVTSHQAFFTREALHNIAETTLENAMLWLEEKKIVNEINYV